MLENVRLGLTAPADLSRALREDAKRSPAWKGLSRNYALRLFPAKTLREGMRVEAEHTPDPWTQARIAADHLVEHPDYYVRLARARL